MVEDAFKMRPALRGQCAPRHISLKFCSARSTTHRGRARMAGIGAKELMRTPSGRLSCRSLKIGPLSALSRLSPPAKSLTKAIAARCYPDFLRLPRIGPQEERDSRRFAARVPGSAPWPEFGASGRIAGELDHPLWALLPRNGYPDRLTGADALEDTASSVESQTAARKDERPAGYRTRRQMRRFSSS